MLLTMSSVIYDQKHGYVLLNLMGKIRIDNQEFTTTNTARYHLRIVLGPHAYAPIHSLSHRNKIHKIYKPKRTLSFNGK